MTSGNESRFPGMNRTFPEWTERFRNELRFRGMNRAFPEWTVRFRNELRFRGMNRSFPERTEISRIEPSKKTIFLIFPDSHFLPYETFDFIVNGVTEKIFWIRMIHTIITHTLSDMRVASDLPVSWLSQDGGPRTMKMNRTGIETSRKFLKIHPWDSRMKTTACWSSSSTSPTKTDVASAPAGIRASTSDLGAVWVTGAALSPSGPVNLMVGARLR